MTDLSHAADRLAELLERENAALRNLDLPGAVSLLKEKQAAAAAFDAQPLPPLPEDTLARLRALAEDNRRLLERGLAVQTRLLGLVAASLPHPAASVRYGAAGRPAQAGRAVAFALSARA